MKPEPGCTAAQAAPALSRDLILAASLALIDEHGVEAFSLRALAKRLGVFPTAIYWHVANRNDLIAGAVALALHGVGDRVGGGPWQQRLRSLMERFREAVRRHPKLAPVIGHQLISNSPLDLPMLELIVGALEEAGFVAKGLVDAFNVVVAGLCGFVLLELAAPPESGAQAWAEAQQQRLADIGADLHPALARHLGRLRNNAFIVRWSSGSSKPMNASFEAWLDVIIGGLELRAMRG